MRKVDSLSFRSSNFPPPRVNGSQTRPVRVTSWGESVSRSQRARSNGPAANRGLSKLPCNILSLYKSDQRDPQFALQNIVHSFESSREGSKQFRMMKTYQVVETRNRIYRLLVISSKIREELCAKALQILSALNAEYLFRELSWENAKRVEDVLPALFEQAASKRSIMDCEMGHDTQLILLADPLLFEITHYSRPSIYGLIPFVSTLVNRNPNYLGQLSLDFLKMLHNGFTAYIYSREVVSSGSLQRYVHCGERTIYRQICCIEQKQKVESGEPGNLSLGRCFFDALQFGTSENSNGDSAHAERNLVVNGLGRVFYDQDAYQAQVICFLNELTVTPLICLGELLTTSPFVKKILEYFFKQRELGLTESKIAAGIVKIVLDDKLSNLLQEISWKHLFAIFITNETISNQLSEERGDRLIDYRPRLDGIVKKVKKEIALQGFDADFQNRSIYHYTLLLRVMKKVAFVLGAFAHIDDIHRNDFANRYAGKKLLFQRKMFEIAGQHFKAHQEWMLSRKCFNIANFLNLIVAVRRMDELEMRLQMNKRAWIEEIFKIFKLLIHERPMPGNAVPSDYSMHERFLHHYDPRLFSLNDFFEKDAEKFDLPPIDVGSYVNRLLEHLMMCYGEQPEDTMEFLQTKSSPKTLQSLAVALKNYSGSYEQVRNAMLTQQVFSTPLRNNY